MLCYAKKSAKYNLIDLLTLYWGNFPKFIHKSAGLHCLLSLLFLAQDFMSSKLCCVREYFLSWSGVLFFLDGSEVQHLLLTVSYSQHPGNSVRSVFHSARIPSTVSNIEVPRDLVVGLFGMASPHDSRFLSPSSGSSRFTIRHRLFLLLSGTACSLPIGRWTASSRASTSWTNRLWSSHLIRCQ